MNEGTSVLLGLEDEFAVLQLERIDPDTVRSSSRSSTGRAPARAAGCSPRGSRSGLWFGSRTCPPRANEPSCGGSSGAWCAANRPVGQRTFTQQSSAVPARSRLTTRLREKIGSAIASGNRAVSEVAAEYEVAWSTAHRALIALANRWLPEPEPTRVLGIDETRARSVRWVLKRPGGNGRTRG